MSAQQTIYERIKEDLKGDKILQNVILERLWYYLEPIKDITGGGGASITNGTADPTGGADGDYYIQTTVANQIWYNNLGTWSIILSLNPVSVEQSEAGNMEAGIPFYPFYGQIYKITNLGITGIDHILSTGVKNPSNAQLFDRDCKAWVTSLDRYVTCTYDVATNKINIMLETVFRVTQTGTSDPTVEVMRNDLVGVTFTGLYSDVGIYTINPSISLSTIGTGIFNQVFMHLTGSQVASFSISAPFVLVSGYYDELNDVARFGSQVINFAGGELTKTDGIINELPMYLICILSN